MKAIIFFRNIAEISSYSFTSPLSDWIKKTFQDVVVFDIDNLSDAKMYNYLERLRDESDSLLLILENGEAEPAKFSKLFRIISAKKEKTFLLIPKKEVNKIVYDHFPEGNIFCSENDSDQKSIIKTFLIPQL